MRKFAVALLLASCFASTFVTSAGSSTSSLSDSPGVTLELLDRPQSNADAVAKAQMLQAALTYDRASTLSTLFSTWCRRHNKQYDDQGKETEALSQFSWAVDQVVRYNSDAHEGAWFSLNDLSGAQPSGQSQSTQQLTQQSTQQLTQQSTQQATKASTLPHSQQLSAHHSTQSSTPHDPSRHLRRRLASHRQVHVHGHGHGVRHLLQRRLVAAKTCTGTTSKQWNTQTGCRKKGNNGKTTPPTPGKTNATLASSIKYFNWADLVHQPVKDQGYTCASAWAFAATSGTEYALAIWANKSSVPALSTQALVNCANAANAGSASYFDMDGCSTGSPFAGLLFMSAYSVPLDVFYPYKYNALTAGTCNTALMDLTWNSAIAWVQANNPVRIGSLSELDLKQAVATQPVVVYWNVLDSWLFYAGGIYGAKEMEGCPTNVNNSNHAMLVVGFNNGTDGKYWIAQNSYGTNWGIGGFAYVQMTGNTAGPCGMYGLVVAPALTFQHVPASLKPGGTTVPVWRQAGAPMTTDTSGPDRCDDAINNCVALPKDRIIDNRCCNQISSVAFSPNNDLLAVAQWDYTIRLWNVATRQLLATLRNHTDRVTCIAFSPDGNKLASSSSDRTIKLWDVARRVLSMTLTGHMASVNTVTFSKNGTLLVSGSGDARSFPSDATVRVWSVQTGTPLATPPIPATREVDAVAISPNGRIMAMGTAGGYIELHSLTSANVPRLSYAFSHQANVNAIAFHPNGTLMASAGSDKVVMLWDIRNASMPTRIDYLHANSTPGDAMYTFKSSKVFNFTSHGDRVMAVAFSPDGRTLVTGSAGSDRTVRLWDVASRVNTAVFTSPGNVMSVSFARRGDVFASGSQDGQVRMWKLY